MATQVSKTADAAMDRLLREGGHVHLVGACGVGMAGLAALLEARGLRVSGCDIQLNRLSAWLKGRGVTVCEGHDPDHIDDSVAWVVRSAAVAETHPEIERAVRLGRPVFRRGEVLPWLLAASFSVAVSGTHGKTTTTAFIAQVLRSADRDPSWFVGAEVDALGGLAHRGEGGTIVVEADESDGTVALYRPDLAVVTNIEFDHMEHFADVEAFEQCFRAFVSAAKRVVYCADDPRASSLCGGLPGAVGYGFTGSAAICGVERREGEDGQSFSVRRAGALCGRIELGPPGHHNALNALAAVAVALELGVEWDEIRRGLSGAGLPRRRLERVVERDGVTVMSDYAHHPSEVRALLDAVGGDRYRRRLAVFQPHRFSRTVALGAEFPPSFAGADTVVLTPVYAASEAPLRGGSMWDLYAKFRGHYGTNREAGRPDVLTATSLEQAWEFARREVRPGDLLLIVGAGDVERLAGWAGAVAAFGGDAAVPGLPDCAVRYREPLARHTTLGVGGYADAWVEARSTESLAALLQWSSRCGQAVHVMGAGSNVLASDLGLRGVTVRLAGDAFTSVDVVDGELVAGAGVTLAHLLGWAEERGLAGLEFLEGIPGTVGGALCMNAGAWGDEIGNHVSWIRGLSPEGGDRILCRDELALEYRGVGGIEELVLIGAAFLVRKDDPEAIRGRRAGVSARRQWLRGVRCAGSVFRNPPGRSAGRLLEASGAKGLEVGGARVYERHANVIVTSEGATASDVRAVIEAGRERVMEHFGIRLETEVVQMG